MIDGDSSRASGFCGRFVGVILVSWNRHTFASRMVMRGASMRTVAQLMRHRMIQMTMRYAHLAPDHEQNAVALLVNRPVATSEQGIGDFDCA
jgi:hypothetical protein